MKKRFVLFVAVALFAAGCVMVPVASGPPAGYVLQPQQPAAPPLGYVVPAPAVVCYPLLGCIAPAPVVYPLVYGYYGRPLFDIHIGGRRR